jgi:hypothetical protein
MKKIGQSWQKWVIAVLLIITFFLIIGIVVLLLRPVTVVTNFEQCRTAGGALLETYPEQCMINGVSFTNSAQSVSIDTSGYIGMIEEAAMAKAEAAHTPARVVERDGEGLPATMDFVFGRHNLYVKDGKVYKVDVEGYASDLR